MDEQEKPPEPNETAKSAEAVSPDPVVGTPLPPTVDPPEDKGAPPPEPPTPEGEPVGGAFPKIMGGSAKKHSSFKSASSEGAKPSFRSTEQETVPDEFFLRDLKLSENPPSDQNMATLRDLIDREPISVVVGRYQVQAIVEHVLHSPLGHRKILQARPGGALEQVQLDLALERFGAARVEPSIILLALNQLDPDASFAKSLFDQEARVRLGALRELNCKLVVTITNTHRRSAKGAWKQRADVPWLLEISWQEELLAHWAGHLAHHAGLIDRMRDELSRRWVREKDYFFFDQLEKFHDVVMQELSASDVLRLFVAALERIDERAEEESPNRWRQNVLTYLGGRPSENLLEQTMLAIVALVPELRYHGLYLLGAALLRGEEVKEIEPESVRITDELGRDLERQTNKKNLVPADRAWRENFDLLLKKLGLKIEQSPSAPGGTADRDTRNRVVVLPEGRGDLLTIFLENYPRLLFKHVDFAISKDLFFDKEVKVRSTIIQYLKQFGKSDPDFYFDSLEEVLKRVEATLSGFDLRRKLFAAEQLAEMANGLLQPRAVNAGLERLFVEETWQISFDISDRDAFRLMICLFLARLAEQSGSRAPSWPSAVKNSLDDGAALPETWGPPKEVHRLLRLIGDPARQEHWYVLKAVAPWLPAVKGRVDPPGGSREVARLVWLELLGRAVGEIDYYDPTDAKSGRWAHVSATQAALGAMAGSLAVCDWALKSSPFLAVLPPEVMFFTSPGAFFGLIGCLLLRGVVGQVPADTELLHQLETVVQDILEDVGRKTCTKPMGPIDKIQFGAAIYLYRPLIDLVRYARTGDTEWPVQIEQDPEPDISSDPKHRTPARRLKEKLFQIGELAEDRLAEDLPEAVAEDLVRQTEAALSLVEHVLELTGPLILLDWIFQETGIDADKPFYPDGKLEDEHRRIGEIIDGIASGLTSKQGDALARHWTIIEHIYSELAREVDHSALETGLKRRVIQTLIHKAAKLGKVRRGLTNRMAKKETSS